MKNQKPKNTDIKVKKPYVKPQVKVVIIDSIAVHAPSMCGGGY
jgi:hypothetical protein